MSSQSRPSAPRRVALGAAALVGVWATGCGDDATAPGTSRAGCAVASDGSVTIVAEDVAWDVDCVRAPADRPLSITVDNRDVGVNHNLHVTGLPGKPSTPLEVGPVVQELVVPAEALRAGDYAYVCDIHPNMTGTLEVVEAAPEGDVSPPR